jgi:hypothetical protein
MDPAGFEPAASRLRGGRSATELRPQSTGPRFERGSPEQREGDAVDEHSESTGNLLVMDQPGSPDFPTREVSPRGLFDR